MYGEVFNVDTGRTVKLSAGCREIYSSIIVPKQLLNWLDLSYKFICDTMVYNRGTEGDRHTS